MSGVRLDSGDLVVLARSVRRILDKGGLNEVTISPAVVSTKTISWNSQDGTRPSTAMAWGMLLVTSSDSPALDCAYKLEEDGGVARRKRSIGKASWPGLSRMRAGAVTGRMATWRATSSPSKATVSPANHPASARNERGPENLPVAFSCRGPLADCA